MAKVILICGKICSGKTLYCKKIVNESRDVVLSIDEIYYSFFQNELGENFDSMEVKIKAYLHKKAVEIVKTGTNVILDWGFWIDRERREITDYYKQRNITYEWHYIDISEEDWHQNIKARNEAVYTNKTTDFNVDVGLLGKLNSFFNVPKKEEIDVWYVNQRINSE